MDDIVKETVRLKITVWDYSPEDNDGNIQKKLLERSGDEECQPDVWEFTTEAEYIKGERCVITYSENEELGMGNSNVKTTWLSEDPQVISVMRSGEVETVMVFEPGRRHISAYNLPGMSFEMCTHTFKADNSFDGSCEGEIYLDYIIEIRGAFAGRRKIKYEVLPQPTII